MTSWLQRTILGVILLVSAALRLTGIAWDNYDHHHPDERYIGWVATTIDWPSDWADALKPSTSSINPYYWSPEAESKGIVVPRDEQRKFAYGHLPLYLGVFATRVAERISPLVAPLLPSTWRISADVLNASEMIEYRHLTAVSRVLTGMVDVGTVALLFFLGKRIYGAASGLLAAAFLALNVMHIQLAHFFAFDPYVTFFVVAAVTFMVYAKATNEVPASQDTHLLSRRKKLLLVLSALCVGLAIGSKFAAIGLFLPLLLTIYMISQRRHLLLAGILVSIAILAFIVTNPFAVLDLTCELITPPVELGLISIPALDWRSCFLDNISLQGAMVRGEIDLPFTRQYAGTAPYLYYIEMQLRAGMGPLLGLVAFLGFGWAVWNGLSAVRTWFRNERIEGRSLSEFDPGSLWHSHGALFIILAWTVPFFTVTGGFYVKFMRYMQPLTPFLMLFGAAMICRWSKVNWRRVLIVVVICATGIYAASFVDMYRQPHPWTVASEWIYANVEEGSLILSEKWDDALPANLVVNDVRRRRSEYRSESLTWLSGIRKRDDIDKLASNLDLLADADYLALASNRIYGVVPRLPSRYPNSSKYHALLFDGSLGYEIVAVYGRFPSLWGVHLKPDSFGWPRIEPGPSIRRSLSDGYPGINWGRVDESFTVYDQPLTMIFENVARKSAPEMMRLFDQASGSAD